MTVCYTSVTVLHKAGEILDSRHSGPTEEEVRCVSFEMRFFGGGFAFVRFHSMRDAEDAMDDINGR